MPKLKEITPQHLRCPAGDCPAVYDAGDELVIIGKVGPDEFAVRIRKEYLPGAGG